ncbi:MAG: DUF423 domain-containing protein [Oligoflexia bacterium]|nr:DUF423 domain-containing protein [Oligoflexia bacterium]
MTPSTWVGIGAASAFIAVACGAFGAHGLEKILEPRMLEIWKTGAQYQMYHALALIGFGLWAGMHAKGAASNYLNNYPGWAFLFGTILFSGSLYALALTGIRILGAVTPFGGLAFLLGWILFAFNALRA